MTDLQLREALPLRCGDLVMAPLPVAGQPGRTERRPCRIAAYWGAGDRRRLVVTDAEGRHHTVTLEARA